jgi:hypothetical protein
MEMCGGVEVWLHAFISSGIGGCELSVSSPGDGIPWERIPCFKLGRRLVGSKSQSGEEKSGGWNFHDSGYADYNFQGCNDVALLVCTDGLQKLPASIIIECDVAGCRLLWSIINI